jgi:hypothetical protein
MYVRRWLPLAVLAFAPACSRETDETGPTAVLPAPGTRVPDPPAAAGLEQDRGRHERLAQALARALRDAGFRQILFERLSSSRFREGKVHLQGFLGADGGRERSRLARLAGIDESAIAADLDGSSAIEVYLPVPEHRTRWRGDDRIMVATAETDQDAPAGFELTGRRVRLDPARPPDIPVLMVARAEQRFEAAAGITCLLVCGGGTGSATATPGLYLTRTAFGETFEGWFKGDPEFEVHILGHDPASGKMTT